MALVFYISRIFQRPPLCAYCSISFAIAPPNMSHPVQQCNIGRERTSKKLAQILLRVREASPREPSETSPLPALFATYVNAPHVSCSISPALVFPSRGGDDPSPRSRCSKNVSFRPRSHDGGADRPLPCILDAIKIRGGAAGMGGPVA